ncbi:response regulator [Arcobacteraceae bacterium]|nr:response regulator [Arcobacteraceae bacterium]
MNNIERLKNKTILLVEDEKIIRENIASMLRCFFKEVYIAIDGFDGLDKYEEHLPDIVMTDLKMPNMNGFELMEELKKRSSSSYTIIVSAHTDTEHLIEAINIKIDRYLIKPLTENELFEAFNAYFEKIDSLTPENILLEDGISVNIDNKSLTKGQDEIHLNKKETLLLKLLCSNMNTIFSYEEIEYQVWGNKSMSISALRSVVRDLRKKMGSDYIINISGNGYKLK